MRRFLILSIIIASCEILADESIKYQESDNPYSQNTWGGIGLIQNPTARFSDDGELLFGISSEAPINRLFGKAQFLPWMEAIVRLQKVHIHHIILVVLRLGKIKVLT